MQCIGTYNSIALNHQYICLISKHLEMTNEFQMVIVDVEKKESIAGKGGYAVHQHFLLFQQSFLNFIRLKGIKLMSV